MATPAGLELQARIVHVSRLAELLDSGDAQLISMNSESVTYLAPECDEISRAGEHSRRRVESASDCYSFGVSMLSMCVHREPPNICQLMHDGRRKDLEDLGSDHSLHSVISKCLLGNPAHRPSATYIRLAVAVEISIEIRYKKLSEQPEQAWDQVMLDDVAGVSTSIEDPSRTPPSTSRDSREEENVATEMRRLLADPDKAELLDNFLHQQSQNLMTLLADFNGELARMKQHHWDEFHWNDSQITALEARVNANCKDGIYLVELCKQAAARNHSLFKKVQQQSEELHAVRGELRVSVHLSNANWRRISTKELAKVIDKVKHLLEQTERQVTEQAGRARFMRRIVLQLACSESLGLYARYALLIGPKPRRTKVNIPLWKYLGRLPSMIGGIHVAWMGQMMHHRGKAYVTLADKHDTWILASADSGNLSGSNWTAAILPGALNSAHGNAKHRIYAVADTQSLYILITFWQTGEGVVYQLQKDDKWRRVTDLPEFRKLYAATIHENQLYVLGAGDSPQQLVHVKHNVYALDLTKQYSPWVYGPRLGGHCKVDTFHYSSCVVYGGYLHVVIRSYEEDKIHSASLSHALLDQEWSNAILPKPEIDRFELTVINSCLVCIEDEKDCGSDSPMYILFPMGRGETQWLLFEKATMFDLNERALRIWTDGTIGELVWTI
ncbi:uncharacterized protein LOC135812583 [Sycon ciliatum]|uniref:uncharacterized protein LOC135812583 n=1 Tax=Sycon ciliatum TaxID=27933 RepID=UPI0031F6DCE1